MHKETIEMSEQHNWNEEDAQSFDSALTWAYENSMGWEFLESFKDSYNHTKNVSESIWDAYNDWDL